MRLLITGSHGLIGSALILYLRAQGHQLSLLCRTPEENNPTWNPAAGELSTDVFDAIDGVIHLAGESIASSRWSSGVKKRLRESRLQGTRLLSEKMAACKSPPRFLLSASAIGYYGSRGSETLTEASGPGSGFLAQLATDWEEATKPASNRNIAVCTMRFGMVLSAKGGAIAKMLPAFKLGAGGVLGDGEQYMSWIHIDDLIHAIDFLLKSPQPGPYNFCAPEPVTNRQWTQTLAHTLDKPAALPIPAMAARLLFGEMADAVLLSSTRAVPERLTKLGFSFRFPHLKEALQDLLHK